MTDRFVGLTHVRALAITLVFFFHYGLAAHPAWIERAGAFGWTGVDLFFVLSGFLIARQLFASDGKPSLRQFYFKRALRILPAYGVVVAIYFALPFTHEREALPPLWRFLTFTQNFGLDLRTHGTFSHAWSLCIEEQFYLVLPLVLLAIGRRAWLIPLLVVAGLVARASVYQEVLAPLRSDFDWYQWIYYPTWSRLDGLLVGISLAAAWELRPAWRSWLIGHSQALLVVAVGAWAVSWWLFVEPTSLAGSLLAFPAIAIAYGLLVASALGVTRASAVTHWLARLSYSLYLSHKICIHVTQERLSALGLARDGNLMLLCCALTSLAGAAALYFAVERPFLRWRDRVTDQGVRISPPGVTERSVGGL
jgi:peptidoglycan/LPS O-acetylase OafA/YrhL